MRNYLNLLTIGMAVVRTKFARVVVISMGIMMMIRVSAMPNIVTTG
ncbi:MAG: hypothetical protein AB1815_07685 [Bacillota bacterium]